MPLTPAQTTTLAADIAADPVLSAQPATPDGAFAVAAAYNLPAAPDFWVWKTSATKADLTAATSGDGTTFTWAGNGFIGRTVQELLCWQELFSATGTVNPAQANVRQAFTDIFSGSGNAAANRAHLAAVGRRRATRAERLFATGAGSPAAPATLTFEGALTYDDVLQARAA